MPEQLQNNQTVPLCAQLEAILFFKAEPMTTKELASILKESESTITESLSELEKSLTGRGVALLHINDTYTLTTTKETATLIEKITKEELSRDIGKAGMETLAIILYKGAVTRREIDFIRGVNSTFIIRNLLIRGLVERVDDTTDKRQFHYRPTSTLLSYLGLSNRESLPEFARIQEELIKVKEGSEPTITTPAHE